jgi:MPBQ/MSBQ methyltransferase
MNHAMNNNTLPANSGTAFRSNAAHSNERKADLATITAYYAAVADDYRAWSPDLNMHFGYWRWGINPFKREAMLDALNQETVKRLALSDAPLRVADMGCGAGATARTCARMHEKVQIDAVTISPEQIARGLERNAGASGKERIRFTLADYAHTPLPSAAFDCAYAVESACHANGPAKHELIREMARLLKPGGRLVVTDAFRRSGKPLPGPVKLCYDTWCRNWAVPELAQIKLFTDELKAQGFANVKVEEISHRIAACALHIPFLATSFFVRELWKARGRLSGWRLKHIIASYCAFLIGAWLPGFGYFIVTAQKDDAS